MLEIKIKLKSINYSAVVEKVLPPFLESLAQKEDAGILPRFFSKVKGLSVSAVKAALAVFPQDAKDELAISCLSYYKEDIVKYLNQLAAEQQLELEVSEVNTDKV